MGVKVLLIGLDGATFSVLDPMVARGVMPFLGRFLAGGARANLRTIVPPLTPPAWTSLMTGRSPGHHGVFDFFRMDFPESRHIRFSSSRDISVPTIWDAATAGGMRVTALNYCLTFPAPKVVGYVVPGWVPWRQLRLACHPPDLFDRLKALPGFEPRELAMDVKLEERATEGCSRAEEYAPWIEFHTRRERHWFDVFRHLTETAPSELTAVVFDGVDKLQHLCWRFVAAEPGTVWEHEWERRAHELCLEYFRHLDGIIERMCSIVGSEASVVIASDHGFGPTHQVFHVNAWLEKRGYLAWSKEALARQGGGEALLGVGQVARHTFLMDWGRTRAFATTPTSNGIFIVRGNGDGRGVPEAEYHSFRERLVRELLAEKDPATGEALVSRVDTREEAFPGRFSSLAPDLTLSLADGGLVSILPSDRLVSPRLAVAGSHRPLGVFLAKGPGVRRGADAGELSILDVAPTLLYGLGLPVPAELEGRVPEELFEPEALRQRPVRAGAAAGPSAAPAASATHAQTFGADEEEAVMKRLQELGYVE
jgi:predicted AlkP superfamily phosphohydrolase/phosphomutase